MEFKESNKVAVGYAVAKWFHDHGFEMDRGADIDLSADGQKARFCRAGEDYTQEHGHEFAWLDPADASGR